MTETGDFSWRSLSWYCPNCGQRITAYQNGKGEFKAACCRCRTVSIRIPKGRRHGTIEVYAPKGLSPVVR